VDSIIDGAEGLVSSTLSGKDELLHQWSPSDVPHGFKKLVLNLVETQLIVFTPRHQLKLAVIYALVVHPATASPKKFLRLMTAMSRKDGHGLDGAVHGSVRVWALVVEEQVAWLRLRHGQ
jgi:hypothetical protein